ARTEKEIAPAHLQQPAEAVAREELRFAVARIYKVLDQERIAQVDGYRLTGSRSKRFVGEMALGDDAVAIAKDPGKAAPLVAAQALDGQAQVLRLADGTGRDEDRIDAQRRQASCE